MKRLFLCALFFAVPALAQQAILVGAAMPQSGILADLAADLRKALLLWQEEGNAGGGLHGRRVELQLLDDRSESTDAGKLYERLIRESRADLLIGPFGSAASLGAAAVAERSRRVLVNATGGARLVHRTGFRYVFQTPTPLGAYGRRTLGLPRGQSLQSMMLLARDESFPPQM